MVRPLRKRSTREPIAGLLVAVGLALAALPAVAPSPVDALGCVRITSGKFDAPGDDNLASKLNGEYVRIANVCTFAKALGRWRLHDYGAKHSYTFASTFTLRAGGAVYIFSGRGRNTASKLYWGRASGAIWNNAAPERAYLRTSTGALMSTWSPFDASPTPTVVTPTPTPTPSPTPVPTVASFTYSVVGLMVTFDGTSSLGETTYSWDFGDGAMGVGASPSHVFANAGTYLVTLVATGPGGSDIATRVVIL